MIKFYKLLGTSLLIAMMTLLAGCDGGGSTTTATTGTVSMNLTDAPVDDENVEAVYVAFSAIHYKPADANWTIEELNETRVINLLELQDGNSTFLAQTELPAGQIEQVRFMIVEDECKIKLFDEEDNRSLNVPSGEQTGYKAVGGFVVPAGGNINVTADFDVRKSLVLDGKGYKLKPTIKIIDNAEVGEINGTLSIDANNSTIIIYAYEDGTWDDNQTDPANNFNNAITSSDATDGSFTLPWLTAGTYDLVVAGYDNIGGFENIIGFVPDITVNADETTSLNITDDDLVDAL